MDTIHLRVDVRLPRPMYEYLSLETRVKKLSFEGLILAYIQERMDQEKKRKLPR